MIASRWSRPLWRSAPATAAAWPGAAQVRGFAKKASSGLDGRVAALEMALKQIEASFGKGAIMRLGDQTTRANVEVISTGSLALDAALGIGGLPRGRVVELYGPESSGKTTLALHVIAEAQKAGGTCAFIDAEHALDPVYASALGVDLDTLYLSQPDSGEQALEIADIMTRSGSVDVVVVDSVAALVPKAEMQGEMGDQHIALQARLMSQALRKLTSALNKSKTLIIFLNQIRSKVGVLFGSPDVTPGGNALKFYSSIRMEIRRTGQLKQGTEIVGNATRVKIAKNKLAPPFRQAEFDMIYGKGISRSGEVLDYAVKYGLVRKAGAWFSLYNEDGSSLDPFAQGKEKARQYLEEHKEVLDSLAAKVSEHLKNDNLMGPTLRSDSAASSLGSDSEEFLEEGEEEEEEEGNE